VAGDVFVNRGPNGEISRLNAAGNMLADIWVDLHSAGLWGGLTFDQTGTFGGRLVAADINGKVFLVDSDAHATQLVDLAARMGMWAGNETWTGWIEVPPGGQTTNHSLGSALHLNNLHLFAVRDDGHIVHKRVFIGNGPLTNEAWMEVPGGFVTDASVSAAVATGRLALCAKGTDNQLYINELACGERSWSGSLVPGGGHTNANPAVVSFQDELWLLIKGLTSNRILTTVRSASGNNWSEWAELPGGGRTNAGIAAVSANGRCYLAVKGLSNTPWINVASNTGTGSGWSELPNPGTTDVGLTMAAIGARAYLFAKGINDRQLYVRRTT
jgi:hypothetical protein